MKAILLCCLLLPPLLRSAAQATLRVGEPAPEIRVTRWLENEPTGSMQGKFILLDFWATWCAPCLRGVPKLNALLDTYAQPNFVILSLSNEPPATIEPVLSRVDFRTAVATDVAEQTQTSFGDGVRGMGSLPFAVLIDDRNIVRWFGDPADLTEEMVGDFLAGDAITVIPFTGTPSDASLAVLAQPSFDLSGFSTLLLDEGVTWTIHLSEADPANKPGSVYIAGKGGFQGRGTLEEIFRNLFPRRSYQVPESVASSQFTFGYLDKHPTPESSAVLESTILDYLGLRAERHVEQATEYELRVRRKKDLVPDHRPLFSGKRQGDNGERMFKQCTLPSLAGQLTKATDHYWYFRGKESGKYVFEIDMTSVATILASLANYGIEADPRQGEREIVRLINQ